MNRRRGRKRGQGAKGESTCNTIICTNARNVIPSVAPLSDDFLVSVGESAVFLPSEGMEKDQV